MTKISNQYSLTNVLFADTTNGRVGVNNTSPTVALDVTGAGKFSGAITANIGSYNPSFIAIGSSNGNGQIQLSSSSNYSIGAGTDFGGMGLYVGGAYRTYILNNGNVGIGTTSPVGAASDDLVLHINNPNSTGSMRSMIRYTNYNSGSAWDNGVFMSLDSSLNFYIGNQEAGAIIYQTSNTERMRITGGGDLYFGSSSITTATTSIYLEKAGGDIIQVFPYSSGSSVLQYYYRQNGALVGSISYNGTNTLFNGTSDYRLKEDLKDYNGLEILSKLKTYNFNWKNTNVRDYGMIAHELQEVLPNYVTGEKDALNKDGSINPQGVDYSKIVPVLIKSIQEQQTQINELKALINA